jgi:hypothetical protein
VYGDPTDLSENRAGRGCERPEGPYVLVYQVKYILAGRSLWVYNCLDSRLTIGEDNYLDRTSLWDLSWLQISIFVRTLSQLARTLLPLCTLTLPLKEASKHYLNPIEFGHIDR